LIEGKKFGGMGPRNSKNGCTYIGVGVKREFNWKGVGDKKEAD
jgi:hypothetical protein